MVSEQIQTISFQIISNVGEGKSLAIEAIRTAQKGNYQQAENLIQQAENAVVIAEKAHLELIAQEAGGKDLTFSMLLMHAEDQMLSTQTVITLATELVEIWKTINPKTTEN